MKRQHVANKYYVDWFSVAPGVWGIKDLFVNVYLIHNPEDNKWVLVDAGLKTSAGKIRKVAKNLFWPQIAPSSIILTHAHFDHVGSLQALSHEWNVPVYAHYMEEAFLTGKSSYPPPDPSVGGGLLSWLSWVYPKGPINIQKHLKLLPQDGTIPGLPEWKYIHTPGHSPGHISLYRQRDGVLIVGDAFVTTRQESAFSVMFQIKRITGPPKYFTYNWVSAASSVRKLASLNPQVVATGHGRPMQGEEMRRTLHNLSEHFAEKAVPAHGRYVDEPALVNKLGVQYVPPSKIKGSLLKIAGFTAGVVMTYFLIKQRRKRKAMRLFSSG